MALTQLTMTQGMQWVLAGTAVGTFAAPTQGSDTLTSSLTGLSTATWNQLFVAQYAILHGTTQAIDLSSFTNLVGQSVAFAHVLAMTITVSGTGTDIRWKPSAVNGLVWPVLDVSDAIVLGDGASFSFSMGASSTGKVVDGTHKSIDIINNAGAGTATVRVAILGSTT